MIHCEVTVHVPRPPSVVFAFVDDASKMPSWLGMCVELRQTSAGPKQVGTTLLYTYRQGGRESQMSGVVTEREPDRRLGMQYQDQQFAVAVSLRLEPSGTGTQLTHIVEITPKSFAARLMSPLIRGATQKQLAQDTAKLVALLGSDR
jgi:uncharacterized protein YndB with AHSA1/START domain